MKAMSAFAGALKSVFSPEPDARYAQAMSDAADKIEAASNRVIKSSDRFHDTMHKMVDSIQNGGPKAKSKK